MHQENTSENLEVKADEEARRLFERILYYSDPGLLEIDTRGVDYWQEERFCQMVEAELRRKGEEIQRNGKYFTSSKYCKK